MSQTHAETARVPLSATGDAQPQSLRTQLAECQAALRAAAPRLAAFTRLEELARAKGTTPEAIAESAALEVARREKDALTSALNGLVHERDQLKGEVAMLLINKNEIHGGVDSLRREHEQLSLDVAELISQITRIRGEAVRLMHEKTDLVEEIAGLRDEVRALNEICNAGFTLDPPTASSTTPETTAPTEPAAGPAAVPASPPASIAADSETEQLESEAFDAFFHAEIDHDKARDWILG